MNQVAGKTALLLGWTPYYIGLISITLGRAIGRRLTQALCYKKE